MRFSVLFTLMLGALALSGCESFNKAVGLEKTVPDEFTVSEGAPLAIPPDYALRPPRPGAAPTQEVSPTDQAKETVFRAGNQQAELPGADQRSAGENLLLKEAGAADAAPNIRQTLTLEARADTGPINDTFIDKLLFWRGPDKTPAPANQVIDPTVEAQHLKGSEAAANAPPTASGLAGAPIIERTGGPKLMTTF
ncbi:MAG TPA: DUF3035 domain-containing protein [Stellaceae bacterium]|nr:DUF3035 domain-containing protein [Stellaceae bacterium]